MGIGPQRRPRGCLDATIAWMAKFKPAKGKSKVSTNPRAGLPCVILLISGMVLMMLFFFLVMRDTANR
jgi:hypothetical protein